MQNLTAVQNQSSSDHSCRPVTWPREVRSTSAKRLSALDRFDSFRATLPALLLIQFQALLFCVIQSSALAAELSSGPRITERQPWTASNIKGVPDPPPPYVVEPAFPDLTFTLPLELGSAPGLDRIFVAEQGGKIFSFRQDSHVKSPDPVIDLKQHNPEVTALYSITFHPDFEKNHYIYLCYITKSDTPDGSHISRFTVSATEPPVIDPASEVPVLQWWAGGHNGCSLKFGPDGYLYISTGDGGGPSPPDPLLAGQDVTNLLSAILRIDVNATEGDRGYRVPPDNPLIGMPGARPEIWAYGFRNPWRMSFDPATGELWVGDVGWQLWEMIYRVEKGGNYGWPIMEGPQPALPESPRGPTPILPPTVSHPHSEAASITGGYVYRGSRLPELKGAYVYGDFQTGRVWALRHDGKTVTWQKELAQTPLALVGFGEDTNGELYLVDYNRTQTIYQLAPNPQRETASRFPQRLSETGLFTDLVNETPSPGVTEYEINAHHWADGTSSRRWLALPGDQPVSVETDGGFVFPDGAVIAKTVSLESTSSKEHVRRRLETQILHREQGSWRPYSYRWNDGQTDAELVPAAGDSVVLKLPTEISSNGKATDQATHELKWRFAARSECQLCHNAWIDKKTSMMGVQSASPLAFSLMQLNRGLSTSGPEKNNQLTAMKDLRWLTGSIPEKLDEALKFVSPYDEHASLNARARSWLHVNCAHCHQPHAGGSATIELMWEAKLEEAKLLNVRPSQGAFGIAHGKLIAPGDPIGSILHYRVAKMGNGRMPRLGSEEVDERGVALIHDWIAAMPAADTPAAPTSEPSVAIHNAATEKSVQSLKSDDPATYESAIRELTATTRGAVRLSGLLQKKELTAAVTAAALKVATEHPQSEVRDVLERFVPAAMRQKRLGTSINVDELLSMEADPERGRLYFFREGAASCRSCHRVRDSGETLGPDLSQIGKKYPPKEMLLHVLEPSRFIDQKYVPWVLESRDGFVHTGLLVEKTENHVVLRDAQNREVRVAAADVETLVSQQKSLMPELLLRDLTPQQAADLIAWLCSLK